MLFKKKVKDNYTAPVKTLFDGTNEEVLQGFGRIVEDVKEILNDDEFPTVFIAPEKVNENASKKELGELYIKEKVGEKFYSLLKVFIIKKPDNIYHILDTLFCAKSGTYRARNFKDTIRDLKLLTNENLKDFMSFFTAASSLK